MFQLRQITKQYHASAADIAAVGEIHMFQLRQITKQYHVGEQTINALCGISVKFKEKELVAILGPSGCGKTTLMNIIGGLDKATSGELIIEGVSTQDYKENDWNSYRNHQIGFVFQAYNLISHMTVLDNVELALTLSGVSAKERRHRAMEALSKVGLGDQAYKKPNQMSGGQMQRVAIARAIVNRPKILLADEPTGAVDTNTGIQIMEILKEISQECLVVLVTHNQDLASQYASRIVKMQDGLIISDEQAEKEKKAEERKIRIKIKKGGRRKRNKTNMSFLTAIKLSFNNLLSKKGRSFITIISGAISVICIALILAMNSGFGYYISDFEKNNLSRFPIRVTTQTTSFIDLLDEAFDQDGKLDASNVSLGSMLDMLKSDQELREKYTDTELIYLSKLILSIVEKGIEGFANMDELRAEDEYEMMSEVFGISLGADIIEFVKTLEEDFEHEWGAIMRNYDIELNVYRKDEEGKEEKLNPIDILIEYLETSGVLSLLSSFGGEEVTSLLYGEDAQLLREMFDKNNPWSMMIDDSNLLNAQYDVLAGRLPDFENEGVESEIVLVVDEFNQLDDFTLFLLGAIEIESFLLNVINQLRPLLPENVSNLLDMFISILIPEGTEEIRMEYNFTDFIGDNNNMPATFVLRQPTDYCEYDEETGGYNKTGEGTQVEVVGILRLKEGVTGGVISGAIGYTEALTRALIEKANNAPVIQALEGAFEDFNQLKETLIGMARRVIDTDFDMDALSAMSMTPRMVICEEIVQIARDIDLSSEQVSLLMESAMLLEDFELVPENEEIFTELFETISAYELTEENYEILLEVLSALGELNSNQENMDVLVQVIMLFNQLDASEENLAVLGEVATLLEGTEWNEEHVDTIMQVAHLLSQLEVEEENTTKINEIIEKLSQMNLSFDNITKIMQIGELLRDLTISGEDIGKVIEIIQLLNGLDRDADEETLGEIVSLALQYIEEKDLSLIVAIIGKINNLSEGNKEILGEVIEKMEELDLSLEDLAVFVEIAFIASQLEFNADNLQVVLEVSRLISELEMTAGNIDILTEAVDIISQLELSNEERDTLIEVANKLRELELTEENREILLAIIKKIRELDLSEQEVESLIFIARKINELDITEEDVDTLLAIVDLMESLNLEAEDIAILRQVAELISQLDLTQEEQAKMINIISLIGQLNLTQEDISQALEIISLVEEMELTAEEQQVLQKIEEAMSNGFANTDDYKEIAKAIVELEFTEEEQIVMGEIVRKTMLLLEFEDSDIENVISMMNGIIELNLSAEEVDLLIGIFPELMEIDFSKGETELLNQLGEIFLIRNVTVAETAEDAWFDSAHYTTLLNSFKLKDLMRPNSVDIYPFSIESRNRVLNFINKFNLKILQDEELGNSTIDYTVIYNDELSDMTASMNYMINTITYVLIGVAAIAVIVAMLLVAIILYISVQDRTKEIGLLRSLGASKYNVSSVFIAETFIIGLVSGIVGVCLALVLIFPANVIINSILGIENLLKPIWWHQFALIGIAFIITVISGLIPAVLASKKDPVLALRTE